MKKLQTVLCCAILCLASACSPDGGFDGLKTSYSAGGAIQKGPFVQGSSITIQPLNSNLKPTGQMFTTQTSNDAGQFEMDGINSKYVEIIANGFYFDEVAGSVSNAPLTMRSIADLNEESNTNVNLITTLVYSRIKTLADGKMSIKEAEKQAERELYLALGIPEELHPSRSSGSLNIAENGEGNDLLIAISVVLQYGRNVGELSELIAKLSSDLANDGEIGDKLLQELALSSDSTKLASSVKQNLTNRYASLDIQSAVPDFDSYLKLFNDVDNDGVLDSKEYAILEYNQFQATPISQEFTLPLLSDINKCEISIEDSIDWITLNITDGVCTISIAENSSDINRTASVILKDKNSDDHTQFTIIQKCVGARIHYTYAPNMGEVYISTDVECYENKTADGKGEMLLEEAPTTIYSISGPITSITIPESIKTINGSIFSQLDMLEQFSGKFASEDGRCLIDNGELKSFAHVGMTEYTIPNGVTSIGNRAFINSTNLNNITIPNGVVSIGDQAFYNCPELTTVNMQSCTTPPSLGRRVFGTNKNLSIFIPEDAAWNYLCTWAQEYHSLCPTLANYNWDSIPASHIIHYTTTNDTKLSRIYLENVIVHTYDNGQGMIILSAPLTTIAQNDFYNCSSLATLSIPSEVLSIESDAFKTCTNLTSITFEGNTPPSLGWGIFGSEVTINIPEDAVSNYLYCDWDSSYKQYVTRFNSLTSSDLDPNHTVYYTTTDNQKLNCGFEHEAFLHEYKDNEGFITFLSPVTSIEDKAFYRCDNLKSITIPTGVTSIGDWAFNGCYYLENITLPENLTLIGEHAFLDNVSLTSITLPGSITTIKNNAFHGCRKIKSIVIPGSVAEIESSIFYDCISLSSITLLEGVTSINDNAFAYMNSPKFTSITLPNSITSIGNGAFYGCSSLTSIIIGNNISEVGDNPFKGCNNLSQFIGGLAYGDGKCLILNGKLCAFAPYDIREYTIPEGVTSIGNGVFSGCSNLQRITIPDEVMSIGDNAFENCFSITDITIPDKITSIGNNAFSGCYSLTNIIIPDKVTSIGNNAFSGCSSLTNIIIPDKVTHIGSNSFYGCDGLTSITIPSLVSEIGGHAFTACHNLTNVFCKPITPPNAIAEPSDSFWIPILEWDAFSDNASGRKIYVPNESVEAYKSAEYWSDYANDIVGYDFE